MYLPQGGIVVVNRHKPHVGRALCRPVCDRVLFSLLACFVVELTLLKFHRETWVLGPQCLSCSNGARFDPSKSTTYVPLGLSTQLKYGSGSVVVDLASETISLGVFKSENEVQCENNISYFLFLPSLPMEHQTPPIILLARS